MSLYQKFQFVKTVAHLMFNKNMSLHAFTHSLKYITSIKSEAWQSINGEITSCSKGINVVSR